jgi:DUF4097 and DUF4098 domain-containing protein YvlB
VTFDDDPAGQRLTIEYVRRTRRKRFDDRRIRVDVTVPEGTQLQVGTASADTEVSGRIGSVTVRSASGDTVAGDVAGRVEVHSASGDLTLGSVADGLSFTSASGDLEVRSVAGPLAVRTASGDVTVGSAAGDVRCTTIAGDTEIRALGAGDAFFKSVSGDIEVGIVPGTGVRYDLASMSGRTQCDLADAAPPERGDAALVLRAGTVSGDIHLRRAADRTADRVPDQAVAR